MNDGGTDIDLAVDDMKGAEFAELVNTLLREKGLESHNIGVIKLNPDQSKHLETATFMLHGVSIDVNNLRSETYSADSRIPEVVRVSCQLRAWVLCSNAWR